MQYEIELTHKTNIMEGDTILCPDGNVRTVGRNDITTGFMGRCLFGDSYALGTKEVKRIKIIKKR